MKLHDCIFSLLPLYSSGNRRTYVAKIMLSYSNNQIDLETAKSDLKYFKKLLMEKDLNGSRKILAEIVETLEKCIESSSEE